MISKILNSNEQIEQVILRGHAFGHSEQQVVCKLKAMGITKADMVNYKQYCKERDDD